MDRRDLLKTTLAAGAALGLGAMPARRTDNDSNLQA